MDTTEHEGHGTRTEIRPTRAKELGVRRSRYSG